MLIWKFIEYIFGYCDCCQHWFVYPRTRRRHTCYSDDEMNFTRLCKACFDKEEEYWDERWEDVYSSSG